MKATLNDFRKAIESEIKWCEEHPEKAFSSEYRKGFINGLIQAKYILVGLEGAMLNPTTKKGKQ